MPKQIARGGYTLRDSPFFKLKSKKKLANILQTSLEALESPTGEAKPYKRCWKHKKEDRWEESEPADGTVTQYRPIDIPHPRLKVLQSRIAALLSRIAPPDFLFSPVKGRSYVDNAARHKTSNAFHLMDIADYFPSCIDKAVAGFFHRDLQCSPDVTAILVRLATCDGSLPQGSPCSPILAYFSNLRMWLEIAEIVDGAGCILSVYADDITVSGGSVPGEMIWRIKQVIQKHGLRLKEAKESSRINGVAEVTGVILRNGQTKIPNRQLKKLAELRHERSLTRSSIQKSMLDQKIKGRKAQRLQVEGK